MSLSPWGGSLCLQVPELEKPTVRILRPERVLGIIRAIKEQGSSKLQVPGPSTVLSSPPPHHTHPNFCIPPSTQMHAALRGLLVQGEKPQTSWGELCVQAALCFPLMQAINISQAPNLPPTHTPRRED